MSYRNKDNNQHIYYQKHDPICINNSNIYIISHAYEKLSTRMTQKLTELENRYQRKSYWCPAGRISELFEYKMRHTKKNYNLFNKLN
jgi:hypothetical protein